MKRREELTLIENREVWDEEYESVYVCPECGAGQIIRWRETTIGFKCSGWSRCKICGYYAGEEYI